MKKALYIFIVIISLLGINGCDGDTMNYNHPNVDMFVKQLKSGTYKTKSPQGFIEVPHFTNTDIPRLLHYSSDLTVIPYFPMPPTTSTVYEGKIRLGECILWIVESIRLGQPASLGCHLVLANAENYETIYFLSDKELLNVVIRYKNWWTEHSKYHKRTMWTIDTCFDNPLCNSGYKWW